MVASRTIGIVVLVPVGGVAVGCAGPARPGPVPGAATLVTHASAAYEMPSGRTADERYGRESASAEIEYSGFTSRGRFHASSTASAEFGAVTSVVNASATDATFRSNFALAEAGFSDTLTVRAPGRSGELWVVYAYRIEAPAAPKAAAGGHAHGVPMAEAHLFVRHQGAADVELGGDPVGPGAYRTQPMPIVLGQPTTAGAMVSAVASIPMTFTAEVGGTFRAVLEGVTVVDATGAAVSGAEVVGASGARYRILPAAVPVSPGSGGGPGP